MPLATELSLCGLPPIVWSGAGLRSQVSSGMVRAEFGRCFKRCADARRCE